MVELTHTIKDPMGLHSRSVMLIAGEAARWESACTVSHSDHSADGEDVIGLMGLGAHLGDTITVKIDGPDEADASEFMAHLLRRL
ncbi:HPr family phosphocarrier protein [uncultured Parolsenella sp.]|uniref:HPr family phosphocarrier protein n=1 Tax=uncultured Parolsenella sp. TaxID=2083008 RepID=UPI0025FFF945|nr:HPr family phosphocarrier protein [uncultured Parolsenella sp.]